MSDHAPDPVDPGPANAAGAEILDVCRSAFIDIINGPGDENAGWNAGTELAQLLIGIDTRLRRLEAARGGKLGVQP